MEVDVAELLAAAVPEEQGARETARGLLQMILADGAVPQQEVLKEARECGLSDASLRRAAKDLNVQSARVGKAGKQGGGHWLWSLPGGLDDQDTLCVKGEHLNPSDSQNKSGKAVKMLTPNDAAGTNQVKMLTGNPQTTLTPDLEQGEHLNNPDRTDDDEVRV